MRLPLPDAGTAYGRLARLTGGVAGVGLVLAAVSPFSGVPPRSAAAGGSGTAPAQLEASVLATGEFDISPVGKVLTATPFPAPGAHGGPSLAVTIRNISAVPLKVGVRLTSIAPSLADVVTVRGSVAGAVVLDGPLARAADWSKAVGALPSGATTTLRLRFKLKPGATPDAYLGHLDVRQVEVRGIKADGRPATTSTMREIPDPTPKAYSPPGGPPGTPLPTPPVRATTPESPDHLATGQQAEESGSLPEGEHATGLQ